MDKKNIKYILAIILIMFSVFFYIYEKNQKIVINNKEVKSNKQNSKIAVYITGAVNKEGVYYCNNNARINDVISEAGGFKKEVDLEKINLAKKVVDGDKIIIPYKKEDVEEEYEEYTNKINLNTASKEKLMEIPGVGESTADKIINYREKNNFNDIEELKDISGIGDAKFEKIKNLVLV